MKKPKTGKIIDRRLISVIVRAWEPNTAGDSLIKGKMTRNELPGIVGSQIIRAL